MYIPLYIIGMSSWVTFWLVKTDKGQETPARTQLGATTVLAVVTIGFGGKAKPQVGIQNPFKLVTRLLTPPPWMYLSSCASWRSSPH